MDRETYVSHPVNLPQQMQNKNNYKLEKVLYGLRQAPLCWFVKLREHMKAKMGYTQLK